MSPLPKATAASEHAHQVSTPVTNADVACALREMALFLEMEQIEFKPRAYEKAAYAVAACDEAVSELYAKEGVKGLDAIPAVGRGIAERIEELLQTGRIHELEAYREKYPVDVLALTSIEGVGPRSVRALYEALGVRTVDDLVRACADGRIEHVPHFGERSQQKILEAIDVYRSFRGRRLLAQVLEMVMPIERRLRAVHGVSRVVVAGSIRRRKDTIGDVDLLVCASQPTRVMDVFASMPAVARVYAKGQTKSLVRLRGDIDADLRVIPEESFGSALLYFTGSKAHNVALRRLAQKRGMKLSEYGLFESERRIAGRTEEDVYAALGLPFIPPELRENAGEIEAAREGRLPDLIPWDSLRGDLQVHTKWTDGALGIEAMAEAAKSLGHEYIAITDHTRDLPMARGLDETRLREQVTEIHKVQAKLERIRILTGAEVNIRPDGGLDVADQALAELDVVGAAIHSHFDQPRAEMTRRVIRAMENPHVDILFHPSARNLGRREGVDADFDAIIEAALRTGTILEIDAQPERLDLRDELVRKAVAAGVKLVISSDAHNAAELRYARELGIGVARRGWARASDVLNTLPLGELQEVLGTRSVSRRMHDGRSA